MMVVVMVDVGVFFFCLFIYFFIRGGNGAACRIGVQDNENTKP